jgi:autotransporter-associated beta strand protein
MTGTGTLNWSVNGDTVPYSMNVQGGLNITGLHLDIAATGTQTQSQYLIANYNNGATFNSGTTFAGVLYNNGTLPTGWSINYGTDIANEILLVAPATNPTLYWTGSNTGTALADATGNWDTTGGNTVWSSAASSGTAQLWVNGDTASFGAGGTSAVAVTIDQSGVTAAGITFNAMGTGGSYTIASGGAGDTLALNGTITMNANATISAPIVGTGALTIAGPDTLTLSGTNTYSGGSTIESGSTVNFTNASALGTGTITIGTGGGTLQYGAASLILANNLTLAANGTIDTNGLGDPTSGVTLAGNITGSADLTINSSVPGGELYLTGSNGGFTGNTTLENGVEAGISTGTAFGRGSVTIGTGGGTVEYDAAVSVNNSLVLSNAGAGINMHSEAGTWAGVISGTNSLLIHDTIGGGSLTLTNVNTYSGTTTIGLGNAVTLALSGSGSIADSSGVSIASGGTFDISATTGGASIVSLGGVSGSAVALGGLTLTITNAATGVNGTFAGIISGTGGGLTLSAGTEILSGNNTYSGGTIINSGATLDVTGSITGAVADNGTFDIGNQVTITDLSGGGALNLGSNSLIINATAADTFSGTLTGTSIFRVASQSLTLTGNLTGFTGIYDPIGGGTLTLNASGLLNSSAVLESQNNGILNVAYSNLNGNVADFFSDSIGLINFTGTNATGALGAINIFDTSGTTTNTIDGGGSANTITVNGAIASNNTSGSNTLVLRNGTFVLAGTGTSAGFIGNGTLQIGNNAGTGATVQFSAATNLPGSSIGINMEGGELKFTGSGAVTIANAITDTASNDIIDGGGSGNALTLSNSITNATGSTLTLQHGIFALTGTNSTTFSGGSLQIGNGTIFGQVNFGSAANLPGTGASIVLGNGELNYTGSSAVTVGNAIIVSTGSFNTINADTQQLTLSNSITNTGGTLMLENGTYVLSGTNNATGDFTGGTLQIGNTGAPGGTVQFAAAANMPGSGSTVALNGGTLTYTGTTNVGLNSPMTLTNANTINTGTGGDLTLFGNITDGGGPGSLTVNGDGVSNRILFCAGAVSYTGTTTITAGVLEFGGNTSGLTGDIIDNAALAFLQSANSSVSGIISGTGSVTQQGGTGTTLTLSGNNTYGGTTTITSGTLEFTGDTSGLTGGIVNHSALVFAQSANSSFGQVISGTGSVTQQGTGTLTFSATNTYSGNTTVNAGGTLDVTGSLYQGAGSGNVLDNGTMDVANGFTAGSLTGTGTLDLTNTVSPLIVTATSIFGGAVTGDGMLEASGTGITLTLNGLLTGFTGSLTSANGGNIVVGTGAGQLASSVNLNINNNLSISLSYGTLASAGNAVNFTGNTGSAGELFVTGTGTGTLGAITITDTTGTTINTIDGNGAANTLTLNGAITSNNTGSGGGNTLVLQNGTFVLANTGTSAGFSGNGTLQIGNGSLATAAQFSSSGNLPASIVGITLDQGTLDYTGTGAVTVANGINLGTNSTTSILENSSTAGVETLTGEITSSADNTLAFSGGTFNLNENSSGTFTSNGTFQIGDAPSTVIVSNANAFGSGGILLTSGSTLETSGAAAGSGTTLAVNGGSYIQQAGSTLALLVTATGNDSINLTSGSATLNGTLDLIFASGSNPVKGNIYDVITTTGTVTGNFSSVDPIGAGNLRAVASFDSGTGEIVTLLTQYFVNPALAGFTPNEFSVATYLNNNAIGPNTPPQIANILNTIANESPAQQAAFLDSVTPQAYAQLTDQSIQNDTFLTQQLFQQVENAFDAGGFNSSGLTMLKTSDQDPFTVSMDAAMASARQQAQNSATYLDALAMPAAGPQVPAQETPYSDFSGFVLGTITVDQLPESSGTPSEHFTTGSVLAGLDYRLNRNLVVGALFNWGYTGGTLDSYGSRQQSSSYTPGVFVGYKQGGFYADGLMSYTYNSYKINRNVSSTVATGEPDSNEYDAAALVGYYFPLARGLKAGPAAGAGFTQVNIDGFHETGSPFDLTVAKQHADSVRSLLGMQALYSFVPQHMALPISINFNAFWQHEFLNSSRDITASFTQLGGGSFLYSTAGPSRDSALLGLGASGYLTKNVSLFVNYETQVGNHNQFAQTVMAGVAVSF